MVELTKQELCELIHINVVNLVQGLMLLESHKLILAYLDLGDIMIGNMCETCPLHFDLEIMMIRDLSHYLLADLVMMIIVQIQYLDLH